MSGTRTPTPIGAVIFDCDGTLVDSEVPSMDVIHEQACAHGLRFTREQAHLQFRGVRMADCVAWIAAQLPQVPQGFAETFTQAVRAEQARRFALGLAAMPGARELLQTLGVPCCVATNGPREKVELTLALTELRGFFGTHVFSAYEVGSFKPEPGLFLHAAHVLGVPAVQCAVVEDSVPGLYAGLAAGMQVFSLLPADGLPEALRSSPALRCVPDLGELAGLLPRTPGH